ncbi:MAG: endonuclease [Muribaculaceae bacterium]|nr:endonuclease [Muribaculaceae bacterium]
MTLQSDLKILPSWRGILFAALLAGASNAYAGYPAGYYDRMEGKQTGRLKQAAKECVSPHTRLDYYGLPNNWIYTDVYPELYDGLRRWWEMYSDNIYLIRNGQSGTSAFSANKMQREHAVPKSWWKRNGDVEYTPAYTDMWNLYPSDGAANQAKLNYPLGETRTGGVTYDNGLTKVGAPMSGIGGGCSMVFEPGDEYKGDFARAFFYMATVYDDLPWCINYMFNADEPWPTLRQWAVDMLLQWARRDPVSQKEIDRNNGVQSQQGNRNPFIDFPELAEYIWGTRTGEVFHIADQGGNVTPPITGDPEITMPVSGEALDFGQAAVGNTINAPLRIQASNLTAPLSVRVSGADRDAFVPDTRSINPSAINSAAEYLLNIMFIPTETRSYEATLALYDGGLPGGTSVTVKLIGEGCPVPQLSRLTALDPTELTDRSYRANWTMAPEVVDYYVVNRVRYYPGGSEGELLEANGTSLLIDGRDPAVAETYSVCSVRLGYMSESSNTISVLGDSGVEGIDLLPLAIAPETDGFTVVAAPDEAPLTVLTPDGLTILNLTAREGERHLLPPGVYFIVSPALPRPVRILVR